MPATKSRNMYIPLADEEVVLAELVLVLVLVEVEVDVLMADVQVEDAE